MRSGILFIHSSDELYGADRMLLNVLRALDNSGLKRTVLVPEGEGAGGALVGELREISVEVERRKLPILRRKELTLRGLVELARRSFSLWREIRRLHPSVVYCSTSAALPAAIIARAAGVRTIVLHNQEIWHVGLERAMLAFLALPCTTVVSISRAAHESLTKKLRAKSTVVLNGVEPLSGRVRFHEETTLRFLVASRWNAWKGHRTLLRAWELARAPGRLVVLGAAPAQGDGVDVRALAAQSQWPESLEIVGEVSNISSYVEAADVMIVPSDSPEPFGLVAVEAFSAGRPVIASRGGGLADIVSDGVDGWLFDMRNVEQLAEILGTLTRDRVNRAGHAAVESFSDRYSSIRFAERYLRFWDANVIPFAKR